MNKKTFFKIVVISSVVLITGGILISHSKKKVKKNTETSSEKELNGYKFTVPTKFDLKSEDDTMHIYIKNSTSLTFYVDTALKDYEEYTKKHVFDILCYNWLFNNGKIIDYRFLENEKGKKALLSAAYKVNTGNYAQYIVCYVIPKDNKLIMIIAYNKCESEKDVDSIVELIGRIDKNFEKRNF